MSNHQQVCLFGAALILGNTLATTTYADETIGFSRPGGTAIVEFDTESNQVPTVVFGKQPIAVVRSAGGWRAMVGLNPGLIPGDYVLGVKSDDKRLSVPFRVLPPSSPARDHRTPTRPVETVTETPGQPACAQLRIQSKWRDSRLGATYLELPLPIQSRRLVETAKLIQSGAWLQIDQAVKVRAPTGGTVIAVDPPESSSVALAIDHGHNIISILCPVANPLVTLDAEITRGHALGDVGTDGRLWWTLMLNGQRVNPLSATRVIDLVPSVR